MSTLVANTIKPRRGDAVTFADCNVSVGGTVTYEDVTNVDSVGIVTARSGIEVSGIVTAIAGAAVTYYGSGLNLTGIESGVENFVASGTIDNGATVVLNTDGTVGIVTQTNVPPSAGDATTFTTSTVSGMSCAFDTTNNKVVIAYQDQGNSNYGTAVVGTVSGDTISFGTPVVFNSGSTWYTAMSFVGSSKVVIFYYDNPNDEGRAIVGTVSGTSITYGSAATFNSTGSTDDIGSCYDSGNDKVVVAYRDLYASTNNSGWARVGTVSGTSITFGTAVEFKGDHAREMERATVYIGSSKVVIGYRDWNDSHYGKAIVGTVSGTSISFGSEATFNAAQSSSIAMSWDENAQKIVVAYVDGGQSWNGYSCVGTVSGTSISFGSEVVFDDAGQTDHCVTTYDPDEMKVVLTYNKYAPSNTLTAVIGTVSGTSISWGSHNTLQTHHAGSGTPVSTYDTTANKTVIAYTGDTPNYGRGFVLKLASTTTNLTTENYIGIAGESIANAATGEINVLGGVNSSQSGLTTAQTYYVAPTGILTTTAGTPSVVAGTSISSTEILIR